MVIIQIVLGIIIIAIGVNLGIVVNNFANKKKTADDAEACYYDEQKHVKPSILSKVLTITGYTISALIVLAGIGYIIIQLILDNSISDKFNFF